jgi:hypothetical protein
MLSEYHWCFLPWAGQPSCLKGLVLQFWMPKVKTCTQNTSICSRYHRWHPGNLFLSQWHSAEVPDLWILDARQWQPLELAHFFGHQQTHEFCKLLLWAAVSDSTHYFSTKYFRLHSKLQLSCILANFKKKQQIKMAKIFFLSRCCWFRLL